MYLNVNRFLTPFLSSGHEMCITAVVTSLGAANTARAPASALLCPPLPSIRDRRAHQDLQERIFKLNAKIYSVLRNPPSIFGFQHSLTQGMAELQPPAGLVPAQTPSPGPASGASPRSNPPCSMAPSLTKKQCSHFQRDKTPR